MPLNHVRLKYAIIKYIGVEALRHKIRKKHGRFIYFLFNVVISLLYFKSRIKIEMMLIVIVS